MSFRILLTYASRRGSTAEAADTIASVLRDQGSDVVVLPVRKVRSVSGYDAVILGTAIRAEKPLSGAVRFVSRFGPELSEVPVALFVLCLTMMDDTAETRKKVTSWVYPLVTGMRPRTFGLFAGAAERHRLGFFLSCILSKILSQEGRELGDYRDWSKIRVWAESLSEAFRKDTGV